MIALYMNANINHANILPPTLILCHFVIELQIIRSRKFTVIIIHVNANVLTSQTPYVRPAEFLAVKLDVLTK